MTRHDINTAVAHAVGLTSIDEGSNRVQVYRAGEAINGRPVSRHFDPINDWRDCGPLITRLGLEIRWGDIEGQRAWVVVHPGSGRTTSRLAPFDDPDKSGAVLRRAICEVAAAIAETTP